MTAFRSTRRRHVGYVWLSLGLLLESFNGFFQLPPEKNRCTRRPLAQSER